MSSYMRRMSRARGAQAKGREEQGSSESKQKEKVQVKNYFHLASLFTPAPTTTNYS